MVWEVPSRSVVLWKMFFCFKNKQNQVNYLTLSAFSSLNENMMDNISQKYKWELVQNAHYLYFYNSSQSQRGGSRDKAACPLPMPDKPGKGALLPQGQRCSSTFDVFRTVQAPEKQLLLHPWRGTSMPVLQFAWSWNLTLPPCRGLAARSGRGGWHSSLDRLAAWMRAFKCHSVPTVSKYAAATRQLLRTVSPSYKTCYVLFTQHWQLALRCAHKAVCSLPVRAFDLRD